MVGSTGKVMKEAYFKGNKGLKTFLTGPLDPEHNRLKLFCQICKTNWSIFSKGAREMIRHYGSESHLRKDQRWKFEHLRSVDKVTWQVRHEVRGQDVQILTALELEKEKPLFENAVLVDNGDKHPFDDDYMAGVTSSASFEEIKLYADFLDRLLCSLRWRHPRLEFLVESSGHCGQPQRTFHTSWVGGINIDCKYFLLLICGVLGSPSFHRHNQFIMILDDLPPLWQEDIAHHVNISSKYSFQVESTGLYCVVSIRFWKGDYLSTARPMRYRLASDPAAGMLTEIAQISSFLSVQHQIVSVSRKSLWIDSDTGAV